MTWFKMDDSFWRSRKVRKLGRDRVPAVGLWALCGDWSADNLTDGFVPWEVVEDWDRDREWACRLLDVTLWEEAEVDGEKGVQFHDWDDWQPTKDQVEQRRKADAERRARWREEKKARDAARAAQQGAKTSTSRAASQCDNTRDAHRDATVTYIRDTAPDTTDQADDQDGFLQHPDESREASRRDTHRESQQESRPASALPVPSRPVPSRPDPVLPTEEPTDEEQERADKPARRKRPAHPLPDTWKPNENHAHYARENGLDLAHEADQFRAHAEANDKRQVSWDATFRQWMGNAKKWNKPRLKAASGQHQAWRNPADQSVYDDDLI